MTSVLVTGANGFVGRALCDELVAQGYRVKGATRSACHFDCGAENIAVGMIDGDTEWTAALNGINVVVHLAARVHVMRDESTDPLAEFRRINTAGSVNLARSAVKGGVRRLVYVSSIGVNGLSTDGDGPFSETDIPNPHNPYSISKWEAEQALHVVRQETGLEIVVVRPPLVYGPKAPGNFAQLLRVVTCGIPLPLGSVHNKRDFIYVGNLVDALVACAMQPAAAGQTYLVSDGEPVSTPELLRRLAEAMGVPSRVFPFPTALLKLAGQMVGKSAQVDRLLGSLCVDSGKIRRELNWTPPYTLQQGLQKTVSAVSQL